MANPDAAVITAIIMVFAILLGAKILLWWLERKDRLEDDYNEIEGAIDRFWEDDLE